MPTKGGDFMAAQLGSKPAAQPPVSPNPAYPLAEGFTPVSSPGTLGAALQFAEANLGGPLVENESNPATSAVVSVAINGSGDRVGLTMVNMGANDIFVAISAAVSGTNGIRLGANGGNVTMNVRDDWTLPSRQWFAVSPTGASQLYILELVRFAYTKQVSK